MSTVRHKRPSGENQIWSRKCRISGDYFSVEFNYDKYLEYTTGKKLLEEALPELSTEERNFLSFNLTPMEFQSQLTTT